MIQVLTMINIAMKLDDRDLYFPSCYVGEVTILHFLILESNFVSVPLNLCYYIIVCNSYQRIEL